MKRDFNFSLLGFLPSAIGFGLIPLMPFLLESFAGADDRGAGNVIAIWLFVTSLAQFPAQQLLRKFGPSRALLFGGAAATLLFPLVLLTYNLWFINAAFAVGAIGAALLGLQATAACEAEGEGRARAFSFLQMGANASAIFAPVGAVLMTEMNPATVVMVLAIARAAASFSVAKMLLTGSAGAVSKKIQGPSMLTVLLSPSLALILLIGTIFSFLYAQFLYTSQIILDAEVLGVRIAPLIISLNAGLVLLFQPLFLKVDKYASSAVLLMIGCMFALVGWFWLALSPETNGLVAIIVFFTAAEVFLIPASFALIGETVRSDGKLFAYACYGMTRVAGSLGVAIGVAIAVSSGIATFARTMCIFSMAMLAASLLLVRLLRSPHSTSVTTTYSTKGETG